jgi:hypothetical protein
MSCLCGCGAPVKIGRRYIYSHVFRGPKSKEHAIAIGKALRKFHRLQRGGKRGKVCPRCKKFKTADKYGTRSKTNGAGIPFLRSHCMRCERIISNERAGVLTPEYRRKHYLKYRFDGMTQEDYKAILKKQNGRCAICRTIKTHGVRTKHFHVDHDHKSNARRGLLCNRCNTGIGMFLDNPKLLVKASEYLIGHL